MPGIFINAFSISLEWHILTFRIYPQADNQTHILPTNKHIEHFRMLIVAFVYDFIHFIFHIFPIGGRRWRQDPYYPVDVFIYLPGGA